MAGIVRLVARRGLLALALGVGTAGPAQAQRDLLGPGAGFLAVGAARISTGELDDWLAARGYPTFGRGAGALGLGGYRVLSSGVMVGFEGQGLLIGEETHGEGRVALGGGYATLGVGYAFDPSPRLRLYPRLGIGAGGMALWIEREDTLDFGEVLEQGTATGRPPVLSRDGMVVDLGLGAELVPRGRPGLLLGLRVGYLRGPFTPSWETDGHWVSDGPEASIGGPYARVVVGLEWLR